MIGQLVGQSKSPNEGSKKLTDMPPLELALGGHKKRKPMTEDEVIVEKDEENERPVPKVWRAVFAEIVNAFVEKDYFTKGIDSVLPVSVETGNHIEQYIKDYGEELVQLPKETWETSIYIWMGTHWDVLIDLWTAGEGKSDLVLGAQVSERDGDYVINIGMVYVP